jgi:hypothetical protein
MKAACVFCGNRDRDAGELHSGPDTLGGAGGRLVGDWALGIGVDIAPVYLIPQYERARASDWHRAPTSRCDRRSEHGARSAQPCGCTSLGRRVPG